MILTMFRSPLTKETTWPRIGTRPPKASPIAGGDPPNGEGGLSQLVDRHLSTI
jgi:hypothetical protein